MEFAGLRRRRGARLDPAGAGVGNGAVASHSFRGGPGALRYNARVYVCELKHFCLVAYAGSNLALHMFDSAALSIWS